LKKNMPKTSQKKWARQPNPLILWEHLTCAMSINAYSSQKLENLEPDHKEK